MRITLLVAFLFAEARAPEPKPVWAGPGVTLLGGPSADGRYLSYVDPASGGLGIRDLATGVGRIVVSKPGSKEFAYFSSISPDSKQIAYAWFNSEGFYELRLIALDGGEPRTLYRNEEAGFVQPCAWTPDGRNILTLFFRKDNISQIALVPAAGGPMKVLKSLSWVYPKKMDVSPDGKYVVYDTFAKEGAPERTLFVLGIDGASETRLITAPGNHLFGAWTPDGKSVIYASDQSAESMDARAIDVADGKPRGESRILRRDLGRAVPLGVTRGGVYYYGVRKGAFEAQVATLDSTDSPKRVSVRYQGRNSNPAWSADGAWIAYLSRRGSENFGVEARGIVVRPMTSTQERELEPKLAHIESLRWYPDGKALLVSGSDGQGRGGLYRVEIVTSAVTAVVRSSEESFRGYEAAAGPDFAAYIRDGKLIKRMTAGGESVVAEGAARLAVSTEGALAWASDASVTFAGRARALPFSGITELAWMPDASAVLAGNGDALWLIPVDGEPRRVAAQTGRSGPIAVHPDGRRFAYTIGGNRNEVWSFQIPK